MGLSNVAPGSVRHADHIMGLSNRIAGTVRHADLVGTDNVQPGVVRRHNERGGRQVCFLMLFLVIEFV